MMCELTNDFVSFNLYFEGNFNIHSLCNYFGNYFSIKEHSSIAINSDLNVSFFESKNHSLELDFDIVDNHLVKLHENTLYVGIDFENDAEALFIKRFLIDLSNRFFELKGGIFIHSSSIVDNNKSVIFFGNKGAGKTTNMLYMLNNFDFAYSSNEKTGLLSSDGKIISYGSPSKIGVRANTLKQNLFLKEKLDCCINHEKYFEYTGQELPRDCRERLEISFDDIKSYLQREICPVSNLKIMCNLVHKDDISLKIEQVNFNQIKDCIEESIIDGVFPQRKELNSIFSHQSISIDNILRDENIKYFKIYQDGSKDNSEQIYRVLKREL